MKARTLSFLAGVATPLILTTPAPAGFVGIKVVGKDNPFGLIVCNVYAEFDRPGEDLFTKVSGTANAPILIQVEGGGTFFNQAYNLRCARRYEKQPEHRRMNEGFRLAKTLGPSP